MTNSLTTEKRKWRGFVIATVVALMAILLFIIVGNKLAELFSNAQNELVSPPSSIDDDWSGMPK